MSLPGYIVLRRLAPREKAIFEVECHTEDERGWGGYSDPLAPFRTFLKREYELVEDRRAEGGS